MIRSALLMTALVWNAHPGQGQTQIADNGARITLAIPPVVPSETVQIKYFMTGQFGGYGGFVRAEKGLTAYSITASADSKPAFNVKIIAYLPGCEIVKLDIPVSEANIVRSLPCKKLEAKAVHGQISEALLDKEHGPTQILVEYFAIWGNHFFGIMDGPVTTFEVATALLDKSGAFVASVPDLKEQSSLGDGEFR
ncbi:MAG: hypothetical protein ACRYFU_22875 [Janthinobacterium lividum]